MPAAADRAIFFCNFPPPVTGQTVGTELVAELLEPAFAVTRIDTSDGRLSVGRSPLDVVRRVLHLVRLRSVLRRQLESLRPEVFYFVVSSSALGQLRDAMAVRLARRRAGRVIAHVRSGNFQDNFKRPLLGRLSSSVVRGVDRFIFLSEHLSCRAEQCVPAGKRVVVPNTIDAEIRMTDEEVAAKLARRGQRTRLRVVFIANMTRSKGYQDLALALAQLPDLNGLELEADFVGAWPSDGERQAFDLLLRDNGLEASVRVHGAVDDRGWIRSLLAEADVLALPTYYPVEAQPRTIIEALNAGTPIVATRHASIPEYVDDGVNGYLVAAHSPAEIAAAIGRLADGAAWRQMAEAARQSYLRLFDPAAVGSRLRTVFAGGQ